ncbi:ATPase, T2SS/T4P/T4SS family [Clostridium ljungdahlii]|uniref:Putative conjugal transfer protein n=1 Tax=Clostridium ljungdahlii TaxID=1538 RepID=A0A166REV6_9CLOT|nr:ATPase, T2SS/T4P/T4SS family [Clostridium ljungdahlii]OAA90753.1 putative conjugal transfer protein [Clostridium ljungdahlii]
MPLTVDLDDINYSHHVMDVSQKKNLNEIIDDIVDYLVKNCELMINDIEKNKKPVTLINDEILKYIKTNKISVVSENKLNTLITSINNYIWGYGPIQPFVNNKDISDIYIFNKNCVAIKKYGKLELTDVKFPTDKSLLNFCYNLAIKNGGSLSDINAKQILSDSKTQKDAILRIDIVIDPITYTGSQVEIGRLPKKKKTFEDLIKDGMLNAEIQKYLITAVRAGLNIVWTGRGGSGKTTLINSCLDYVPPDDVQLIMQESEELFTSHKATYLQKVKKKLGESDIEYTLKDLTINALIMSLDRMVIGEIKDEERLWNFSMLFIVDI